MPFFDSKNINRIAEKVKKIEKKKLMFFSFMFILCVSICTFIFLNRGSKVVNIPNASIKNENVCFDDEQEEETFKVYSRSGNSSPLLIFFIIIDFFLLIATISFFVIFVIASIKQYLYTALASLASFAICLAGLIYVNN